MGEVIFQASDLAQKRVEVLEAARGGAARVRDRDGTSLIMVPEERYRALKEVAEWGTALLRLEVLLARGQRPTVGDLGKLAWLRVFDNEDLREFVSELHDALVAAHADGDPSVLDDCIRGWRVTAGQLSDPLRKSVLQGKLRSGDLVEAPRPDDQ